MSSKPPRLLKNRHGLRRYFVWGFPLDMEAVRTRKTKLLEDDAETNKDYGYYIAMLQAEFRAECWEVMLGGDDCSMQIVPKYGQDKKREKKTVIAIVQATRPDDTFVPKTPDKIQQLKEYFAMRGHPGEPGWFFVRD